MINNNGGAYPGFKVLAACLMIFFFALQQAAVVTAASAPAPGESFLLETSRPVSGWVNSGMARAAALADLRRQASARLAPGLAKLPEIEALLPPAAPDLPASPAEEEQRQQQLLILTRFLLDEDKTPSESLTGGSLTLRQNFRVHGGADKAGLRRRLALLLGSPALQENYGLALNLESDFLDRYDAAVEKLLNLPDRPDRQNRAASAPVPEKSEDSGAAWEEAAALHNSLRATSLYLDLLPALYGQNSLRPDLLEPLEEINRLLPENYLLLSELGRFYLWQERSGKAGQALDTALRLNPGFDQAYGHRGALWLLRHKPSLALADFNRAISLARHKPESQATYRHGRAVVWKALGNTSAMCEDLRQSCLLGQCAAYEWAVAGRECPR